MTTPTPPPSIYSKFKLYVKTTGSAFLRSDSVPILESTALDYPLLRCLLRARGRNRLVGPANGFQSKIKWKIKKGYGAREPGTPVTWNRRGSLEFMASHYCHEFGTLQLIEDEIKKQVGSVWSPESMAQQFDSVLENNKQDLYVDIAESIEDTLGRVPDGRMEDQTNNIPRSIFAGMNEWKAAHGDSPGLAGAEIKADGAMPGVTLLQNYDVTKPGTKVGATVEYYDTVGKDDGTTGRHLFEAFARGLRNVNFRAVPLAEQYTQGSEGFREVFASLDGHILLGRTLAAHDNVIASMDDAETVYDIKTRFKGMEMVDWVGLEDIAVCPKYTSGSSGVTPDPTSYEAYDASLEEQSYETETSDVNSSGPRFYIPFQEHIRPIWDPDSFMAESPMYELRETTPDAMVMYVKNDRNLHFESFRRNLVIRPAGNI